MTLIKALLIGSITLAWGSGVWAQDLPLQSIDSNDFGKIIEELSANFNHTSVSGAGTLGRIFGFEVGVVGGVTKTPELQKLARETDSSASADQLPHGEFLGVLTVPLGITAEVGLIPKVGSDDFKFNTFSVAGKFTPTEIFLDLPLDLAIKAHVTKTNLEFKQTISTVPTTFEYENTIMGLTLFASKNFVLLEPYVGLGYLKAKGELSATGSTTVFDSTYTSGTSASESKSSTAFYLGSELKLLFFKLGLEYGHLFGTSSYTGKLSFFF